MPGGDNRPTRLKASAIREGRHFRHTIQVRDHSLTIDERLSDGGADAGIPLDAVERMRAALVAFGKDGQSMIHVYDGMPHAFNADYRPSYRKEAADDGWKRMLAWFKKNGVA